MALTALRLTAEAISDGDIAPARAIIQSIEPEPDGDTPSIAQVIGVSAGVLDTWHTEAQLRAALQGTHIPVWEKHAPGNRHVVHNRSPPAPQTGLA